MSFSVHAQHVLMSLQIYAVNVESKCYLCVAFFPLQPKAPRLCLLHLTVRDWLGEEEMWVLLALEPLRGETEDDLDPGPWWWDTGGRGKLGSKRTALPLWLRGLVQMWI